MRSTKKNLTEQGRFDEVLLLVAKEEGPQYILVSRFPYNWTPFTYVQRRSPLPVVPTKETDDGSLTKSRKRTQKKKIK